MSTSRSVKGFDPFLWAHQVFESFFDISTELSPASIKDQVLRARLIVDRAAERGLINRNRPLLLIGAGFAGLAAADRAIQYEIPTTLLEKREHALWLQAESKRFIDPTLYDWPASHYPQGVFPWRSSQASFVIRRGEARTIVKQWKEWFVGLRSRIDYRPNTVVAGRWPPVLVTSDSVASCEFCEQPYSHESARGNLLHIRLSDNQCAEYGAVISTRGLGKERSNVGGYRGYEFWSEDALDSPNAGVLKPMRDSRILISGGGDGGLQDFLRMVLLPGASLHHFYQALCVDRVTEHELLTLEQQTQRSHVWGATDKHDHATQEHAQQQYQATVDELWRVRRSKMEEVLQAWMRPELPTIHLHYSCTHFHQPYALNRFLALLVAPRLKEPPFLNGHYLDKIECRHNPAQNCHGLQHHVDFVPRTCDGAERTVLAATVTPREYDEIIIRHGIETPTLEYNRDQFRPRRQLLPYYETSTDTP